MTATVFLTQYSSFGGRKPGRHDDIDGSFPQVPGAIISFTEISATSPGVATVLDTATSYIGFQSFGGDVFFNYDTGGVGTLTANSRDRLSVGMRYFQGVMHTKTGVQHITQINFIDTP